MITCPECGGLNPTTSRVCGNCGKVLNENAEPISDRLKKKKPEKDPDKKGITIFFTDILLLIASILSWMFVPSQFFKFAIAATLFLLAEKSNHNKSIFLILTRIIALVQVIAYVLYLVINLTGIYIPGVDSFIEYVGFY